MGRKAARPLAGVPRRLKVDLSDDLAADLWAFCQVHHGAPQNRVIEKALRRFIVDDLEEHPTLKAEFARVRQQSQEPRPAPQIVKFKAGEAKGDDEGGAI
jgi:hypothetical protein